MSYGPIFDLHHTLESTSLWVDCQPNLQRVGWCHLRWSHPEGTWCHLRLSYVRAKVKVEHVKYLFSINVGHIGQIFWKVEPKKITTCF